MTTASSLHTIFKEHAWAISWWGGSWPAGVGDITAKAMGPRGGIQSGAEADSDLYSPVAGRN